MNYIADRNGYRAYGAHLPVQPDAVADLVNQQFITSTALSPAVSSTIIPITNRPFRRRYHATPLFRQHILSTTPQPITYSSTPYPIINSTPFPPTQTPIGTPFIPSSTQGLPFSTTQSPISNPSLFSPSAQGFQYSTTPIPPFGISSTTPRPYAVAQSTPYPTDDTVYITPPPRRQNNLSSQDYLHRELLPPNFGFGSPYENNNIGIPNVRPLYPNGRDPSYYNPYRPSGFESRYPL